MKNKFDFLKCYSYENIENIVDKLNKECGEEKYSLEDSGNELIGEFITKIINEERSDAQASFVLSGTSGRGYIMRCIMVNAELSSDGEYHS